MELHTEEVGALMDGLLARKQLYERNGIRWGDRVFIDRDSLPQVVRSLVDSPDAELIEALATLQPEAIIALGRKVDLSQLDTLLGEWLENAENNDEGYWQDLLAEHACGRPARLGRRDSPQGATRRARSVAASRAG